MFRGDNTVEKEKKDSKPVTDGEGMTGLSRDTAIKADSLLSVYRYLDKLLGKSGSDWTLER